jgi:hypothetical protein
MQVVVLTRTGDGGAIACHPGALVTMTVAY